MDQDTQTQESSTLTVEVVGDGFAPYLHTSHEGHDLEINSDYMELGCSRFLWCETCCETVCYLV